jgi:hypothetical protein
MRASHIHSNLLELDTLGPLVAAQVKQRISKETLDAVGDASTIAWLPVEHDIEISTAVRDVLGIAGLRAWSLEAMARSAQGPLIRPLSDGASKLFGITPHALYRVLPRGYGVVYRNCGENAYEQTSESTGVVTQTGVPSLLFDNDYLEGTAGAFMSFPRFFGLEGAVVLRLAPATRTAVFDVSWRRPGK